MARFERATYICKYMSAFHTKKNGERYINLSPWYWYNFISYVSYLLAFHAIKPVFASYSCYIFLWRYFCGIAFPFSSFQLSRMTEAHFRTPYFNVDSYPRDFLSTCAPVRPFITFSYCRILYTACVRPIWIYRPCATLANIPFEYFRVTRCPACVWRLPDRSPLRCSHLFKVLPVASSCRRNRHLFYYVSTPLRILCMLVGVAFRQIGRLCLQGENGLPFPCSFSRRLL